MSNVNPPVRGNGTTGIVQAQVEQMNPATGELTPIARDAYGQAMGGGRAALAVGASQALALAAEKQAVVKAQYEMARMYPRDWNLVRQRVLQDCLRFEFAEEAMFKKPMGKKQDDDGKWVSNVVEGLSIRYAEAAMRHSGNLKFSRKQVDEDRYWVRFLLTIEDLESQTISEEELTITKTVERKEAGDRAVVMQRQNSYNKTVYVCLATEDELKTKIKAESQKSKRQLILEMLPADLKAESERIILDTRVKGASAPDAKKNLMDSFLQVGVTAKDLADYLGHTCDTIQPAELLQLRDLYVAIKHGESTWRDILENRGERGAGSAPQMNVPASSQTIDPSPAATAEGIDALLADIARTQDLKALDALMARARKIQPNDPRRNEVSTALDARRKALLSEKK